MKVINETRHELTLYDIEKAILAYTGVNSKLGETSVHWILDTPNLLQNLKKEVRCVVTVKTNVKET